MKLSIINGRVRALYKAKEHFVRTEVQASVAMDLIEKHNIIPSDRPDYPIAIDAGWYFEGTPDRKRVRKGASNED